MKIANVKGMVVKGMMAVMVAGALLLAAPAKAEAQGFAVGVQVGYPRYDFARRDHYDHLRFEQERRAAFIRQQEWERRQAFLRHQEFERRQAFLYRHDRYWR